MTIATMIIVTDVSNKNNIDVNSSTKPLTLNPKPETLNPKAPAAHASWIGLVQFVQGDLRLQHQYPDLMV